jgi:hypothetical protein
MLEVEIIVQGSIDKEWGEWLGGLVISHPEPDQTVLTGVLTDQAAIYGVLSHLRDLGIPLATVRIETFGKDDGCLSYKNGE